MILNIEKMQSGGSTGSSAQQAYGFLDYNPLLPQTPAESKQPAVAANNSEKSKEDSILTKEMITQLMGAGLTSDVQALSSEIEQMYANPFGKPLNTAELTRKQLTIISKINELKNNKKSWEDAVSAARNSGGLDDMAINANGLIFVTDKSGKISQITSKQLFNNYDKYTTLTNADLAKMRMNNPSLAFDTNIFNVIENAVGSKEVSEAIFKVMNSAQNSTSTSNKFVKGKDLENIKEGMEILQDLNVEEKVSTSSNLPQLYSAANYIMRTLPSNYKNYIIAKAASEGRDPDKEILEVIHDYIGARTSITDSRLIEPSATLNQKEKSDSNSNAQVTVTPWETVSMMESPNKKDYTINPGTSYQFTSKNSPHWNTLPKLNGDNFNSIVTLGDFLVNSKAPAVVAQGGITVGNQPVNPVNLNDVAINTQGFSAVLLPSKINANGIPEVDLDLLTTIEKLQTQIKDGASELEIKSIYGNLYPYYQIIYGDPKEKEANTKLALQNKLIHPFLVASGYASDNNFITEETNKFADRIDDRAETVKVEDAINSSRKTMGLEKLDFTADSFPLSSVRAGFLKWGNVNMYKSTIYMPFSDGAVYDSLLAAGNVYDKKSNYSVDIVSNIGNKRTINSNVM